MGWQFQYWNGSAWVNFANAQIDHILEELSTVGGQEEFVFDLPNTAANRAIGQALPLVQCLFNGTLIFPLRTGSVTGAAVVAGLKYTPTTIEVTAYNQVFVLLSQASSTVTKAYTNTAVSTIAAYICGLAGVAVGSMPSLNVSITFNNANCFKAMQDLATACGLDYWGDGNGFNIGTRDSTTQTLGYVGSNSKRGLDYSKTVDTVIVNGVSSSGVGIQGAAYSSGYSAGNTGSIATFTVKKVSDVATLNNVAALKLQKLNNPSNGNSLECLITQVATWHPGQYVSASRSDLDLVGSYIIQRITKSAVTCTIEVDAAMPQMDVDALLQQDDASDAAAYLAQPSTQAPVNVTLQGLLDLYHLTEGSGTTANDSTPNGTPCPGTISGCSWITNSAFPGELFLSFGGSGSVDCPSAGNAVGGTSAFAVGGWFSPLSLVNLGNLIGKANCFILELYGTQGAVRFGVYIGGAWVYLTSPNGIATAGGRCFALGVYDGTNMYLYVSNPSTTNQLLTYTQAQTGTVGSSTSDVYIGGSNYVGVVAECMIWGRALSAAEVQALFFQPLTQVVPIAKVTLQTLLPPAYSGIMVLRPDIGSFVSESLTEKATAFNTPVASESMTETASLSKTPVASESMSEAASASSNLTPSTFGDSTAEATLKALASGTVQLCRFQAGASSTKGTFKIRVYGYGTACSVVAGVYSDNVGAPNALLATSVPVTAPTTVAWFDIYVEGAAIVNGNYYWLAVDANATFNIYDKTGTTNQAATVLANYPPSLPSTISSPSYAALQFSFNCFFL